MKKAQLASAALAQWTIDALRNGERSISQQQLPDIDVRAFFNKISVETVVDTQLRPASGTPAGAAASFSTPSLQFSNNGALGPSSLAGPPLRGFRTFEGSDWHNQTNLSGGVFLRF